ncbi:MAG: NUDIX hydrolase [Candidatus Zixiibacteriota bacterium]
MQIKDPISSFTYCPKCRAELALENCDHRQRRICKVCGFVDYHNPAPAAGAIVVRDGKLLLVRRAQNPYKDDWCIPAGFMEWDESPRQCAERELKEETGLEIRAKSIFEVYSGTDDTRTNAVLILYFCDVVGGEAVAGDDAAELRYCSPSEIPKNIAFEAHRQAIRDVQDRFPGLLR